jgi:hypothetical protein
MYFPLLQLIQTVLIYDMFIIENEHKFKLELVQFSLYGKFQWKSYGSKIE